VGSTEDVEPRFDRRPWCRILPDVAIHQCEPPTPQEPLDAIPGPWACPNCGRLWEAPQVRPPMYRFTPTGVGEALVVDIAWFPSE
jgi:hypothetical protein